MSHCDVGVEDREGGEIGKPLMWWEEGRLTIILVLWRV